MVVTDCDIKPIYNKKKHGKYTCFLKLTGRKFILLVKECLQIQNMINMKDTIEHYFFFFFFFFFFFTISIEHH